MNETTSTSGSITVTICKYRMPCGYCELKKQDCTYYGNNIAITPTWTTPLVQPSPVICGTEKGGSGG